MLDRTRPGKIRWSDLRDMIVKGIKSVTSLGSFVSHRSTQIPGQRVQISEKTSTEFQGDAITKVPRKYNHKNNKKVYAYKFPGKQSHDAKKILSLNIRKYSQDASKV